MSNETKPTTAEENDLLFQIAEIASEKIYYNKIGFCVSEPTLITDPRAYRDKKLFDDSKDKWQFDALGFIRELKNQGYKITKDSSEEHATLRNQWIPVSERLPDFGELVLVFCRIYGRYVGQYVFIGEFRGEKYGNWHDGKNLGVLPPTHWMPLPEPPKQ